MTQQPIDDGRQEARPPRKPAGSRSLAFRLAALGLIVVSGLAGVGMARWLRPPDVSPSRDKDAPADALKIPGNLFRGWDKPDLVLVVSAQQHGYLLPCGCSRPQKGGLERRYNFIQLLKERGWPVVALDLGDVPQRQGPASLPNVQGLIKYRYAMTGMDLMGYTAVGLGEYEAAQPLAKAMDAYPLNNERPPVVVANLHDAETLFPGETKPWQIEEKIAGTKLKVGVTGVVAASVAQKIKDPALTFDPPGDALKAALKAMPNGKVDLRVLLFQGSVIGGTKANPPEAVAVAEEFPEFPLLVALSDETQDEPSGDALVVSNTQTKAKTMIVSLGHKAKYVGVVGVYKTNKPEQPFGFRYQLVEMSEDFVTPKSKEAGSPVLKLMEEYTAELKKDNYLARYGQVKHPLQIGVEGKAPEYVGSERCKKCHEGAYDIWEKKTAHRHAYQTLVDAKRPSNRQYDPECIVCHTVGFGYASGFKSETETPKLKDVGCESCHGPAGRHVADPKDKDWQAKLNPWKAPEDEKAEEKTKRQVRIAEFCQRCHDMDNDVTWTHGGFDRKWPLIEH